MEDAAIINKPYPVSCIPDSYPCAHVSGGWSLRKLHFGWSMPYSVVRGAKYRCTKKSLSRMMQYFVGKVRTHKVPTKEVTMRGHLAKNSYATPPFGTQPAVTLRLRESLNPPRHRLTPPQGPGWRLRHFLVPLSPVTKPHLSGLGPVEKRCLS